MSFRGLIALIEQAKAQSSPSVLHYRGLPQELSPNGVPPSLLPLRPDFLAIEETSEGFFLFRYTRNQEFCGDTWHQSLQEAEEQAIYEFGSSLVWSEIPPGIEDPIAYGAQLLAE
jgi:hypothetical protein